MSVQVEQPATIPACPPDSAGGGLAFSPGAEVFDERRDGTGPSSEEVLRYSVPTDPNLIVMVQGFIVFLDEDSPSGQTTYFYNWAGIRDENGTLTQGDFGEELLASGGPSDAFDWSVDGDDVVGNISVGGSNRNVQRWHFVASAIPSPEALEAYGTPP